MRGLTADLVDHVEIHRHAGLMGNGRQVQHRVGGAAQRHVDGQGVAKGLGGHDLIGCEAGLGQGDALHPGLFGKTDAGGHDGGNRAVAGKTQTDRLRQAVHGIGRKHAGAGAAGRAGGILDGAQFTFGHLAGFNGAHGLKDGDQIHPCAGLGRMVPGQHGATADHDGGQVQACRRHQHARYDLVAVGDQHQGVEGMRHRHDFDGVGNDFAASQRVLHAGVIHGDAIADPDGAEFNRGAAGHVDPVFNGLGDAVQVGVAGNNRVGGVGDANQGALDFHVRVADGFEQGSMGGPFDAFLDIVAVHGITPVPFQGITQKKIRYQLGADNGFGHF